jgi:hypothetical protein
MPAKILERLISQLKAKGKSDEAARAIAISALQKSGNLKHGSEEPTAKGIRRGEMTPAQRAIDRAVQRSGGKPWDYVYDAKTNRARKRWR